ncbi:MAG: DUF1015 domain-containing protein [Deltaproteobacteria bacterium]|nr:DUF1015 domain-containing protein [Deltaproteobacteria bacterium]
MADVQPFRGLRYDPEKVGDLDLVVSPPYDVIDRALQDELYRRSPYNLVRVDFGKGFRGDGETENRYTRAASTFRAWLAGGILVRDDAPSLYYLEEDYRDDLGGPRTRKGFVAAVKLEDPDSGLYRPHEKTLAGPKADRLELMCACEANLSPIFALYDDPAHAVLRGLEAAASQGPPLSAVTAADATVTRLWRVTDVALLEAVSGAMRGKSFFIADGHHRYETALSYRDLRRRAASRLTGAEPWNAVMMYLTNLWAPGLTVFPTHRVVHGLEGFRAPEFLVRLAEHFEVTEVGGSEALLEAMRKSRREGHALGLAAHGDDRLWVLRLRDLGVMDRLLEGRAPAVLRTLDVTVLHSLILERLLGIDEKAQEEQTHLRYVKGSGELLRVVREEDVQVGFLLNPTRIEEVKAVAEQGERMPQKSTFFYPKLATGLLLNPLW